jgi:uncharacterized membrane protein YfcA
MTTLQAAFLLATAVLAGALNSVAGGGSFLSFPALIFTGVPPIQANATNSVALWPGSIAGAGAYRKELAGQRSILLLLSGVSLVGGLIGAVLLLHTPKDTFTRLIPFLLLFATLLFAFGRRIAAILRRHRSAGHANPRALSVGVALVQLVIATYGGFFGGGIGILMLASLSLTGMENVHEMNAVKTVLTSCINGIAVVTFIVAGAIYWPEALVMIVGAIAGGYGGAAAARKLPPEAVRWFVIAVGLIMTVVFFIK